MKRMEQASPVDMPSRDIVVGDVLWIREEEELPADVIIVGGG